MAKYWHRIKKTAASKEQEFAWAGRAAEEVCAVQMRSYFTSVEFLDQAKITCHIDEKGSPHYYSSKYINARMEEALGAFGYVKYGKVRWVRYEGMGKGLQFYIYVKAGNENEVIPEIFYGTDWCADIIDYMNGPDYFNTNEFTRAAKEIGICVNKRTLVGVLKYLGYEKFKRGLQDRFTVCGKTFCIYYKPEIVKKEQIVKKYFAA